MDQKQAVSEAEIAAEESPWAAAVPPPTRAFRRRLRGQDLVSLTVRCGDAEVDITQTVTQWQYAQTSGGKQRRFRIAAVVEKGGPVLEPVVRDSTETRPVVVTIEVAEGVGSRQVVGRVIEHGIGGVWHGAIHEHLEIAVQEAPWPPAALADRWWVIGQGPLVEGDLAAGEREAELEAARREPVPPPGSAAAPTATGECPKA